MPATMNDLFVRGEPFNGETGEKTGAQLEDLVARAYPAAGSQLVDDSTLQVYSDAAITDDDGNAINRVRVKAGGIGTSHLADGAVTAAKLDVSALLGPAISRVDADWSKNFSMDLANALDDDFSTATAALSLPQSGGYYYMYTDLGAVYQGKLLLRAGGWASGTDGSANIAFKADQGAATAMTDTTYSADESFLVFSGITTERVLTCVRDFYGRYVGFRFTHGGSGGAIKFYSLKLYGLAVS